MRLFSKKSQQELDAAFLKAVSKYKLKRARVLVEGGANPCAQDEMGNTAFHVMAHENPYQGDCKRLTERDLLGLNSYDFDRDALVEFIIFLQAKGAQLDTPNADGDTCMHIVAQNNTASNRQTIACRGYPGENKNEYAIDLMGIFLRRGAGVDVLNHEKKTPLFLARNWSAVQTLIVAGARWGVQDMRGWTPLHYYSYEGCDEYRYYDYLKTPAGGNCLMIKTNDGRFLHELAIAEGSAMKYALAETLKWHHNKEKIRCDLEEKAKEIKAQECLPEKLEKSESQQANEDIVIVSTLQKEEIPVVAKEADWTLLSKTEIMYTKSAGVYALTEIFNFSQRSYKLLTCNLTTQVEATPVLKDFDDFSSSAILEDAHDHLIKAGGEADISSIKRRIQAINEGKPLKSRTQRL